MSNKTLILSSSGLKNILPNEFLNEEFTFVFPEQTITMKTIFAEFISPKVSKLHYTDQTINSLSFTNNYNNFNFSENVLVKFKLLSKGEAIDINEEESVEMQIISILIENNDLFSKLTDLFTNEINETNIDKFITFLNNFSQIPTSFDFIDFTKIIDFISSHFYSIDVNKLKQIPKPIIYSIISNSKLQLQNEDSLFDFINELFDNTEEINPESIPFFEKVEFSNLSQEKLDFFSEKLNFFDMSYDLWGKLRNCLHVKKQEVVNKTRYFKKQDSGISIEYDGNVEHSLSGIIDHLERESGGNVSDNGTVRVTSAAVNHCFTDRVARNAVDIHNKGNYFQSDDVSNSWLKYDFVGRRVRPTSYTIMTRHDYDNYHPRSWVVEGSNTDAENEWTILDRRENEPSLDGKSTVKTFDIENKEGSYRYLRIRQTDKDSSNSYIFTIAALEYFGVLENQ